MGAGARPRPFFHRGATMGSSIPSLGSGMWKTVAEAFSLSGVLGGVDKGNE